MADALDSKSSVRKDVRVQVPPPAPKSPGLIRDLGFTFVIGGSVSKKANNWITDRFAVMMN